MSMRITVRLKLTLLVASALLTLALVGLLSEVVEARNRARLADIEARLVPRLAIGPRIEAEFVKLGRQLDDAIAAQDPTALAETLDTKGRIFRLIAEAGPAIDVSTAALLRWSVQDYYEGAVAVSTLHVQGEPGDRQRQRVDEMQRRQRAAEEVMRQATAVDEAELAGVFSAARKSGVRAGDYRRVIGVAGVVALLLLGFWASRQMLGSLGAVSSGLLRFSTGDFKEPVRVETNDELGDVAREANAMAKSLHDLAAARDADHWVKSAHVEIADKLRGNLAPNVVAEHTMRFLVQRTGAVAGALYLLDADEMLVLAGSYARQGDPHGSYSEGLTTGQRPIQPSFRVGEGIVGQAFENGQVTLVRDLPPSYFRLVSGLGESPPRVLALVPLSKSDKTIGVIELALLSNLDPTARELLESVRSTLAVTFEAADARLAREKLLTELAEQQRELSRTISELKLAQSQLVQSAKMATLGELVAGVAHELNNPLAFVTSHLGTARQSLEVVAPVALASPKPEVQAAWDKASVRLREMSSGLARVADLVLKLRTFSRLDEGTRKSIDVRACIDATLLLLGHRLGERIEVKLELFGPEQLDCYPGPLNLALLNLLANAIDAIADRGTIVISTAVADDWFRLSVADDGSGIPDELKERVIEPFFTTKPVGKGTGLGLSISYSIAKRHGGHLEIDSARGRGTTMTLTFPLDLTGQD